MHKIFIPLSQEKGMRVKSDARGKEESLITRNQIL